MLGKRIQARVVRGYGQANDLGYPTANLSVMEKDELPNPGVYAAWVWFSGRKKGAALIIGVEPKKCEVHILDWSGNLYGQSLKISVVQRMSDIQIFSQKHDLITKIEQDIIFIRQVLRIDHSH